MKSVQLLPKDGKVFFYDKFLETKQADSYLSDLLQEVTWKQEPIILFGKRMMQPRLTALYGECAYKYSGLQMHPQPWSARILRLKAQIEAQAESEFNIVLFNQYRNGQDSMGWHRDNEPELGEQPIIASVSLGATRKFKMRHFLEKDLKIEVELQHGSLLVMSGQTQAHWEHSIPKTAKETGARLNLTFRKII